MTESAFATITGWSYGLALAGYAAFAMRVALGSRRARGAHMLLLALGATAAWALLCLPVAFAVNAATALAATAGDAIRYAGWYAFLSHLFARRGEGDARRRRRRMVVSVVVAAALLASTLLGIRVADAGASGAEDVRAGLLLHLALAVFGLILVEQLVRRVEPRARWAIKPLAIALGGMFGLDMLLYADASLFGLIDANIWVARGFASVIVIPFLAIATVRNTGWTVDLHLSRGVVFHSSALFISGLFLLVVAGAGYFVRYFGGKWGQALQIELLFAAALLVVVVASSGRFRAKLRVFISKHFFSYRFDYREEWLRFTRTISVDSGPQSIQERTITALADLVESPGGALWLRDGSRGYVNAARWNVPASDAAESATASLPAFLERTGWIVSVPEYRATPRMYPGLELPGWIWAFPSPWLVVPLVSGTALLGFAVLATPRAAIELDWEVRDLLKTASRQAASFLGEILATEALLEARKFDAFNRMSAFVVHDLKNLVAQLSLMSRNAKRHRDNRDFQADMLSTVEHVVERMNALMLQLRTGAEPVENRRQVDVAQLVRRVCAAKADARVAVASETAANCVTLAHEDRLEHVIGHLLQNAIDASPPDGMVAVRVAAEDGRVAVLIEDTGEGMTPEFVRERLFKPFQTTKATGTGLGVYESAQYLSRIGGDVQIESRPGAGTRVAVRLPRSDAKAEDRPPAKEPVA